MEPVNTLYDRDKTVGTFFLTSGAIIKIYFMQNNNDETKPKSLRGFAAMNPEKQREIASKGGKASHESGHAHEFTSEEAREAGRKGGMSRGANRQSQPAM